MGQPIGRAAVKARGNAIFARHAPEGGSAYFFATRGSGKPLSLAWQRAIDDLPTAVLSAELPGNKRGTVDVWYRVPLTEQWTTLAVSSVLRFHHRPDRVFHGVRGTVYGNGQLAPDSRRQPLAVATQWRDELLAYVLGYSGDYGPQLVDMAVLRWQMAGTTTLPSTLPEFSEFLGMWIMSKRVATSLNDKASYRYWTTSSMRLAAYDCKPDAKIRKPRVEPESLSPLFDWQPTTTPSLEALESHYSKGQEVYQPVRMVEYMPDMEGDGFGI